MLMLKLYPCNEDAHAPYPPPPITKQMWNEKNSPFLKETSYNHTKEGTFIRSL